MARGFTGRTLLGVIVGVLLLPALLPAAASAATWGYRPQNVTAVELSDGIKVSWSPPTKNSVAVTGYHVIRKLQGVETRFTVVAEVAETTWFDAEAIEPGQEYRYKVKAVRTVRVGKSSRKATVTRSVNMTSVVPPLENPVEEFDTSRSHIDDSFGEGLDDTFTISSLQDRTKTFASVTLQKYLQYGVEVYETGPDWLLGDLQFSLTIKDDTGSTVKTLANTSGPGLSLRKEFRITIGPAQDNYDFEVTLVSGPYTVIVGADQRVWVPGLEITGRIRVYRYQTPIDDCVGDLNTNCDVTVNVPVNGSFHDDYDNDWYRVPMSMGHTYEIRMVPDETQDAAAAAWINGIYNSDGEFLSNDGSIVESQATGLAYHTAAGGVGTHDNVARTTIRVRATDDYYIALGSYGSTGNREGHYTLEVVDSHPLYLDGDDYIPGYTVGGGFFRGHDVGTSQLRGHILSNARTTGYIESDRDRDWFFVELVAGTQYRVTMRGITLHDAQIGGIYSADGAVVHGPPTDDWRAMASLDSRLDFTVPTSGEYAIEATTPESIVSFNNIGQYSLNLRVRS